MLMYYRRFNLYKNKSNNTTISSLKNDINNLTLERNKLTKQLELERNVIDQSLSIGNNAARSSAFSSVNLIYDSNEKTYDYYIAIREQNDKLLSKAKNSKSNDFWEQNLNSYDSYDSV